MRDSFDRAAATYLEHAEAPAALARWVADWLPAERAGRALEVGAGPGVFTRLLLPWSGPVLATDLSAAMCAAGRSRVPEVRWRTMAAERPAAGPWDWILSSGMLQWAADPADVFGAWREQLAPGGRILAGLFASGSLPEWGGVAGDWSPIDWRTPQDWREAIAAGGLRIVRDGSDRREFRHASARDFLRALHGIGAAPRRRLGPGALRKILRDYEARFGNRTGVRATWAFYRFEAVADTV
jgi:SAM-dependent methyltransferase